VHGTFCPQELHRELMVATGFFETSIHFYSKRLQYRYQIPLTYQIRHVSKATGVSTAHRHVERLPSVGVSASSSLSTMHGANRH
jgi:hypothetical protein